MSNLRPSFRKWRKAFERFEYGTTHRSHVLRFGDYGIKAVQPFPNRHFMKFTAAQIEAVRRALTKKLRPDGRGAKNVKVWTRVFPDRPCTKLPQESRMGKGKGEVDHWAAAVRPGMVLFEFSDAPRAVVDSAFKYATARIPFRVKLVQKRLPRFPAAVMSAEELGLAGAMSEFERAKHVARAVSPP